MKDKKTILIKRYQNRKLYDTTHSIYVTLDDVANMIRQGDEVRVIDNKTHDDLSSITLTQIIFEEEKKNRSLLPIHTLRNIIRDGGGAIKEFVNKTTGSVQHTINTARENAETLYGKLGEVLTPSEDTLLRDIVQRTQDFSKNIEDRIKTAVTGVTQAVTLQTEIKKLRQRIMYLEKRLKSYEK